MLTDAQCRNAVCPPGKKHVRCTDSGGMYLQVSPAGSKRWFLKYRTAGVEKQLALGNYPSVTLAAARKARDAAKISKSEGRNPIHARMVEKLKAAIPAGDTFKTTALEWYAMKRDNWSSPLRYRQQPTHEFERQRQTALREMSSELGECHKRWQKQAVRSLAKIFFTAYDSRTHSIAQAVRWLCL